MAKWFPLWLAKNYAMLWFAKGKEKMDFQEVQKILRTSDSMAAKTLNQLEIRGALIKTRKEIDPRIKEYKLIPTGGSDSHGTRDGYPRIGEFWVRDDVLEKLKVYKMGNGFSNSYI